MQKSEEIMRDIAVGLPNKFQKKSLDESWEKMRKESFSDFLGEFLREMSIGKQRGSSGVALGGIPEGVL